MLYPAGLGEDLGKLLLRAACNTARAVEHNSAGAGSALIQGQDVLHGSILCENLP